jgi:tRNA threonylcarbamoyladenosine biosynthesis protein TsaE
MMTGTKVSRFLADAEQTDALGAWFAARLSAGDTLLLSGPVGAAKSHFARALIRARLGRMEDVPSPSFTLVQVYEADVEIWHADLYRLSHPDEVLELGLADAFATAICLIEWPDRLGRLTPRDPLRVALAVEHDGRRAEIDFGTRGALLAEFLRDWPQ